ncbi:MAG: recombination mediator RecR [bacterium]|nr:recombination mediator RecR [bacterium]
MFPAPIQKLISHFQKLPGIGPRQAAKFAMRLTKMTESELKFMANDISSLKSFVGECKECFMLFDKPQSGIYLCQFCRNTERDKNKICVVVNDNDALSIEKTKTFDGLYHILGGHVSLLDKEENRNLNLIGLKNRIKNNTEVILALNANAEGQATIMYLEKFLEGLGHKTSRLAQGMSTGSEIEYADDQTLINALKHRR